jgi:myo-inositol-1(or 4)-monophosphatase
MRSVVAEAAIACKMVNWESILKEAGEQVQDISDRLKGNGSGLEGRGKGAGGDVTMRVDADAEESILELIRGQVQDVRVVAEESGVIGSGGARWTVVVDPIDGSSNYARGLPFYCTSIAVLEGNSLEDVKHGMVRNLINGDTYYSEKGRGAERDGQAIKTSKMRVVEESCVGVDMSKASLATVKRLVPLLAAVRKPAHFGANALEQCFLADGKIDGFVDIRNRMRVVDFAAGYLISKEAGAVLSDGEGNPVRTRVSLEEKFNVVAACNPALHKKLLELVNS